MIIKRRLTTKVLTLIKQFPALAILGPRQVGKTTLVKGIQGEIGKECLYLDLEWPSHITKLEQPDLYLPLHQDKCVIIDEVQRQLSLFPLLRSLIDQHRVAGRFILLGSASPHILRTSSETLAGRIAYLELTPFNFLEVVGMIQPMKLWLDGGFPEPALLKNESEITNWYHAFLITYLERELPNLGLKASAGVLRRLLRMLAYQQGGLWNTAMITRSLSVSRKEVEECTAYLENAYLTRFLHPFHTNGRKRLVKSPKLYIRDSGMLHRLLDLTSLESLLSHPVAGPSWEGFVIEQTISLLGDQYDYYFYRTQDGTEADLVIVRGDKPVFCIEAKMTQAPKLTKSLLNSIQDLGTENNLIVIPQCDHPYPLHKKVTVYGLAEYLRLLETIGALQNL